jgi:hypothetical protein
MTACWGEWTGERTDPGSRAVECAMCGGCGDASVWNFITGKMGPKVSSHEGEGERRAPRCHPASHLRGPILAPVAPYLGGLHDHIHVVSHLR